MKKCTGFDLSENVEKQFSVLLIYFKDLQKQLYNDTHVNNKEKGI
jgi:hypothetical protein